MNDLGRLFLTCLILGGIGSTWAAPLQQIQRVHGDTVVHVQLDQDVLSLSSSAVLTLTIEAAAPLEVKPIPRLTNAKSWIAAPVAFPDMTTSLPGRMRWRQTFRIEPLQADPDGVALPLEPIHIRAGDDPSWVPVTVKPLTVPVTTVVVGPALSGLKDIVLPEPLPEPEPFPWLPISMAAIGALAVLGLGLLSRRWWRNSMPAVAEPSPQAWVLQELDRLEAMALPATGAVERYHTLLAQLVRTYLDRQFGMRSCEQTSQEVLASLTQSAALPTSQQHILRQFLERCDLAKFARVAYSPEDCRITSQLARELIAFHHCSQVDG